MAQSPKKAGTAAGGPGPKSKSNAAKNLMDASLGGGKGKGRPSVSKKTVPGGAKSGKSRRE